MPDACVAAAAPGLPTSSGADFHLAVGRKLAELEVDLLRVEEAADTLKGRRSHSEYIMSRAGEHLMDRADVLIRALSTQPAESLAGAAVQLAAAMNLHTHVKYFEDPHDHDVRAIERLLASALNVLVAHAGLDRDGDGISRLAQGHLNTWRDPHSVLAEVEPSLRTA